MKTPRSLSLAVAAALAGSVVLASAPAYAGGNDHRVIRTGSCSGSADWKLKVKADDDRLEVEGEVDSNKVGQTWAWKIKDNGTVVASGSSTTTGPSGSFSVERRIANRPGTDRVVFKAKRNGEVCLGVIVFG